MPGSTDEARDRTPVALAHCETYEPDAVRDACRRLVQDLGGWGRLSGQGTRVVVKPNLLLAPGPDRPVTTDPAVLRAVVEALREAGAEPVVFDLPGVGSLPGIMRKMGLGDLPLLERPRTVKWRPACGCYGEVERYDFEDAVVVNVAKFKTHGMMGLTLATKNLFGLISAMQRFEWHMRAGLDYAHFAGLLVEIERHVRPALNIIDAVVAMEGNGPSSGTPRPLRCLLASPEALSLDAVACRLVGWEPSRLGVLTAARERGIDFDEDPEVLGDALAPHVVRDFRFAADPATDPKRNFGVPGPLGLHRWLRRHALNRPVVARARCEACSRCQQVCPPRAITMKSGAPDFDLDKCIRCFCCQEICPAGAITIRAGLMSWLARRRS